MYFDLKLNKWNFNDIGIVISKQKSASIKIRGRPIQTSGTSEPIETSVNRSHHGTDADVVKKTFVC